MDDDNSKIAAEQRIKYLELIQSAVTRMAAQSVSAKNLCVTLVTAIFGFAITLHRPIIAFLALVPIMAFGALDIRFLQLERCFRLIFDLARLEDWSRSPTFDLNPQNFTNSRTYCDALKSWSIVWFYLPIGISIIIVALSAEYLDGHP